jgi:type IV secretory pathway VirD2 relaxase
MNKLTYTIETKDFNNETHNEIYKGYKLLAALINFKTQYNQNKDVVLFIDDKQENTLDNMSNYSESFNIANLHHIFQTNDTEELKKQLREAERLQELYKQQYHEQLTENEKLKKEVEQLRKQSNKQENNIYWYEYRLRGFSPGCQPKGHIRVDHSKGRHGIIAYDRQLTDTEVDEYELIPLKSA